MKSLQVLTPAKTCIFSCPFCISKSHRHKNAFQNQYQWNHELWEKNFIQVLKQNKDLKNVVITGTNEPMQDPKCVQEMIEIVRNHRTDIMIELQTRFYRKTDLYNLLDVVAYSISDIRFLNKIDTSNVTNRYVILLTDSFSCKSLEDILALVPKTVSQITFKCLHDSNTINPNLDNWILNHKIDEKSRKTLLNDIKQYRGTRSIRYDENCMDAKERYMIFREDGNLYQDWEEVERL